MDDIFSLSSNTFHIWSCSFQLNKIKLPEYFQLLSIDEKLKAEKFRFQIDKERYIIAKGILRILLGKYLNCDANEIKFDYSSYGKPSVKSKTSLKFNISHSGDTAVFGFISDVQIGVDVEKIKNDFNVLELAQNFFAPKEIIALEDIREGELHRSFFRCWTRKEAFIKAEGSGLSFPLNKFTVSLDQDNCAELLETIWNMNEKDNWSLFSIAFKNGYLCAIAVRRKGVSTKQFDWDKFGKVLF